MREPEHNETTDGPSSSEVSVPDGAESSDPGAVGEHVSAILRAAEEAAEQIRADARRLSDRLLQQAREAARAKIAELTEEAERSRREADEYARDMRMAVEAYAKKHRHDAEEAARQLTDEAEARAKSILESAQEGAGRIEAGARRHQETLRAETQRLEGARRQALNGVGELMATLQELLGDTTGEPRQELDATLTDRRVLGRHRPRG
jgi:cell division septum initiation protein DivIVA